jgi:hypothetical protein
MLKSAKRTQEKQIKLSKVILTVSTMSGAHISPPKTLLQKDKDTTAIYQELSKNIGTLSKVPDLPGIDLEYSSRISTIVPIMKTKTAQAIISQRSERIRAKSWFCLHRSNAV